MLKFRLRQPWLFENECNENLFELSRDGGWVKRQICEVGFETIERAGPAGAAGRDIIKDVIISSSHDD